MGQPEDYIVDDEIFEDEPKQYTRKSPSRKLFRDTENSYIGGVSSGLGHYFGIDAIWIRLIWIVLIFGAGTGVLLYILLWILLPEAVTTSDKLMMTGEPVNISNIERKIKDGITTVTDTVSDVAKNVSDSVTDATKNVDFKKKGDSLKSTSKSFFDTIGDILVFFLKVFAKFIGVILIIAGISSLIALAVACISLGTVDFMNVPFLEFAESGIASTPIWLISMLTFLIGGIPSFFIFYLGLKILINNLKSIGNIAKFSLLGLWVMAIIGMSIIGVREASDHAFDASAIQKDELLVTANDTLYLKMADNNIYSKPSRYTRYNRGHSLHLAYDENNNKVIYSTDVRLIVRSTKDSTATISIEKNSNGRSYQLAKDRAEKINYNYTFNGNELALDAYLTTDANNKFRDQEVIIILYLPEGTTLFADDNTYPAHSNSSYYNDILDHGMEEHYLKIRNDRIECLDCPIEDEDYKVKVDLNDEDGTIKIDSNGVEIKSEDSSLKIDDDGIRATSEEVKVNIDDNGIEITTDRDRNNN